MKSPTVGLLSAVLQQWELGHPAAGGRGMIVGWNPYRGPWPKAYLAVLGMGIPGMPGTPPELSGRAVPVQPPPGSAAPAWFAT